MPQVDVVEDQLQLAGRIIKTPVAAQLHRYHNPGTHVWQSKETLNRPSLTKLFTVIRILGLALLTVLYECARGTGVMTEDGNKWHVGDTTHYPQFKWCDTLVCARRATCVVPVGFVRMPPSCCNKVFTSFRKGLLALKAICCFLCQVQPSHQWTIASQMHLNIKHTLIRTGSLSGL